MHFSPLNLVLGFQFVLRTRQCLLMANSIPGTVLNSSRVVTRFILFYLFFIFLFFTFVAEELSYSSNVRGTLSIPGMEGHEEEAASKTSCYEFCFVWFRFAFH